MIPAVAAPMPKTFFITTAIDYTNAAPHVGHAYEKILADVLARYHRLAGDRTFFLTGVDQHGQKVQQAAAAAGVTPREFVASTTEKFTALWQRLDISFDAWAATTDPLHKSCVQGILRALHDKGEIYRAKYRGFYSVRQEQFLTDKERGEDGTFGPEWGEVAELEEENWYFRLAKYRDWLTGFLDSHPAAVIPSFRLTELRNAAAKISNDLSISRPKSRLSWGIELPFDRDCVTYVWFDALVNYISFAGYGDPAKADEFASLWPALHVIGKDIIIPAHGIYWLIMLHAMGFSDDRIPPLLVHGYVMMDGEKMSKSLGNIRDPNTFIDKFGAGALRYYLMRDCAVGQDMDFTDERLVQRYNGDLANSLGNLLNRSLSMAKRYRESVLLRRDSPLAEFVAGKTAAYRAQMDAHQIHAAIETTQEIVVRCNAYVEETAPWKLAKDPAQADKLDEVLYTLAEALRIVSLLITPVLPAAADAIRAQLAWTGPVSLDESAWGLLPDAHRLGDPVPVFPRIERE